MRLLQKLKRRAVARVLASGSERECPLCDWVGLQFHPHGIPRKRRYDARCPKCGALERHRLAYLAMKDEVTSSAPKTLHVAPEPCIEPWLRRASTEYVSIDLEEPAMMQMDLTAMTFPDESFSLIWCSNVLEHIPTDAQAMREMYRVCRRGGTAIVQVPIWRQTTLEDAQVVTPEDRLKRFYQSDHVRLYGLDIQQRLEAAGFDVSVRRTQDFDPYLVCRHALCFVSTNELFVCRKR